jgi:excisionase family DNA binding protein
MGRDLGGVVTLDGEEHFTTSRAAQELGVSASTLRTMIQQGKVKVKLLHARSALIPKSEIERYKRDHRGHVGRPPKKSAQPGAAREEQ